MSSSRNPERSRLQLLFGLLFLLAVGLKLFTLEVRLADDPTTGVALRVKPSLANSAEVSLAAFEKKAFLLGPDEGAYLGQRVYQAVTRWLWPLPALLWILCGALRHRHRGSATLADW